MYSFTVVTPEEFEVSGTEATAYTTTNVTALNYMFLYIQGGNGKTCYFDDLQLWYEEYADVTHVLDAPSNAVENAMIKAMGTTHKSYAPGAKLISPDLSGTGYTFIGWSTVKGNATKLVTDAVPGESTLYAIYEDDGTEYDDGYIEELEPYKNRFDGVRRLTTVLQLPLKLLKQESTADLSTVRILNPATWGITVTMLPTTAHMLSEKQSFQVLFMSITQTAMGHTPHFQL